MKNLYLLPCSCGRSIPVEPTQAGQDLVCQCGATVEVPTMLEMAALERVEPEAVLVQTRSKWGLRQQMIVGGLVVSLLALAWVAILGITWPRPPEIDPEVVHQQYEELKPVETWHQWQLLRRGLPDADQEYFRSLASSRRWLAVALVVVAAGAGIIGGAFLVPKRVYRRRVRRAPVAANPSTGPPSAPPAEGPKGNGSGRSGLDT